MVGYYEWWRIYQLLINGNWHSLSELKAKKVVLIKHDWLISFLHVTFFSVNNHQKLNKLKKLIQKA